eukprot:4623782-Pyramimonas_sp.AAC.1
MHQAPPLHLEGWAVGGDARRNPEADDNDRVGPAFHLQTGRHRGEDEGYHFLHQRRLDNSAEYHLR